MGPSNLAYTGPNPSLKERGGSPEDEGPQRSSCIHVHEIRPADTLLSIALQYDVPVQELIRMNRLSSTDIWFRKHLSIPCKNPDCLASCTRTRSPSLQQGPPGPPEGVVVTSEGTPEGATAQHADGQGAPQQEGGSLENIAGVRFAGSEFKGDAEAPGAHPGAPSEDVHNSANLAMLVEALIRESQIHPRLARQRIAARGLNYDEALRDCKELRRWEREMDLSPPEILSYLIIHDGDIEKAYQALIEDDEWHRENIMRAKLRQELGSSTSWLCQLLPRLCLRGPTNSAYIPLPSTPEGASGSSTGATPSGEPPVVIGRQSSLFACDGGGSLIPYFASTSVDGLRRRGWSPHDVSLGAPPTPDCAVTRRGPLPARVPPQETEMQRISRA